MKKIVKEKFQETYYEELLDNGLKVIIFHKPDFLTSSCAFGTPYGAINVHQLINGQSYDFNPGIAHFLEHKLFETEGKDILAAFSALGASVNAFTSYNETVYYFSASSNDIDEPLNLLLDFVQDLDISEASVEKEKGIIIQELNSYFQLPDQRLINETYHSLYHNYPLKYDVGGDSKTVNAITKAELEECYRLNYHPSNMVLIITSPIYPYHLIEVIRNNQNKKTFADVPVIKDNYSKEPKEVVKNDHHFIMSVKAAKHIYAIKLRPFFKDNMEATHYEWCLRLLFCIHFSPLNPKYQTWLDQEIINDYFGFEISFDVDSASILFYIESADEKLIKELVDESLKEDLVNEEVLAQVKRRMLGSFYRGFNDIESFNTSYIRDYLNGIDTFKMIEMLADLQVEDLKKALNKISFEDYALIHLDKEEK